MCDYVLAEVADGPDVWCAEPSDAAVSATIGAGGSGGEATLPDDRFFTRAPLSRDLILTGGGDDAAGMRCPDTR